MRLKQHRLLAAALAAGLALVACGTAEDVGDETADPELEDSDETADAAQEDETTTVEDLPDISFATTTAHCCPVGFAHYTSIPISQGFWADEGLDLDQIDAYPGSAAGLQALDVGRIDVSIQATSAVFPAIAEDLDITSYYSTITRNFLIPTVPEDSSIETVSDMAGKTIGVAGLESGAVPMVRAMVAMEGHDPDELEFLDIGTGAEALAAVQAERVDVLALWDVPHAIIESMGQPLRQVSNETFDNLGFSQGLAVRASDLEQPEMRAAFVALARGIAKGQVFVDENPEAAVRIHWEMYPDSRPSGVDETEAMEDAVLQLRTRGENMAPIDGIHGNATDEQVENMMEALLAGGVLEARVEPTMAFTDALLAEINDFDEEEIRAQAREASS